MSLISTRSAQEWAEKLAAEHGVLPDLALREILTAIDRRELSARNPDGPDENWRIAVLAMIDHIDRHRQGHMDPDPVLGPGILIYARWISIDAREMERWLSAGGIERGDRSTAAQPVSAAIKSAERLAGREGRKSNYGSIASSETHTNGATANPSTSRRSASRSRAPDTAVRAWYEKYLETHVNSGIPTSEEDDWAAAKRNFGDRVRQEQIRNLRRELAPPAWRKQGRRPGPKPSNG